MTEINSLNGTHSQAGSARQTANSELKKTNESLFMKLDKDKNGKISYEELLAAGYSGDDLNAMSEAIFKAERNVNKWMRIDADRNGVRNNIEEAIWKNHNDNGGHLDGDLTPEQFAKKYNLKEIPDYKSDNFEDWCKRWIENEDPMIGIKAGIKKQFGKELSDEETQLLYEVMKVQANRWLFKDNALYERLNLDAYTRLVTPEQADSCCGGDISKPPMAPKNACALIFKSLIQEGDENSAYEVKNRLAWAAFKAFPKDVTNAMSLEDYAKYQAEWQAVRDMKASDFRELLKPENSAKKEQFEKTANMTVQQIVDYIDIIEKATGKNFDSEDWSIDVTTFHDKIMDEINGVEGDETILEGKTRADVPPEKQAWLKYLEEHNMLLDQFKE